MGTRIVVARCRRGRRVDRDWASLRACTLESGSNGIAVVGGVIATMRASRVEESGAKVLWSHTATENSQTPVTVPSPSQLASPSVQSTWLGSRAGS